MKTTLLSILVLLVYATALFAGTADYQVKIEGSKGELLKSTSSSSSRASLNGLPPGQPMLRCVLTLDGKTYSINIATGDVNGDGIAQTRAYNNNTVRSNRGGLKSSSTSETALNTASGKSSRTSYSVYCALDASNPSNVSVHSTEQEAMQACRQKTSPTGKVSMQDFHFVMKVDVSYQTESVSLNFTKIEMK